MEAQPGMVSPKAYPIRDPRVKGQHNGSIVNPVRYGDLGGLTNQSKWGGANEFKVHAPTDVKPVSGHMKKIGK